MTSERAMRLLAVDPGGTTGMALYEASACCGTLDCEHFESWAEGDPMFAIDRIRSELVTGLNALVVEEFRISARTVRMTRAGSMTAIEIIGALRWLVFAEHRRSGRNVRFVLQSPSDALKFATDEKLRRLGWYKPGADHARDAARHALLFLVREGNIDACRLVASCVETGEMRAEG